MFLMLLVIQISTAGRKQRRLRLRSTFLRARVLIFPLRPACAIYLEKLRLRSKATLKL